MTENLTVKIVADLGPLERAMARMPATVRPGFEAIAAMEAKSGLSLQKVNAAAVVLGQTLEGISKVGEGATISIQKRLNLVAAEAQATANGIEVVAESLTKVNGSSATSRTIVWPEDEVQEASRANPRSISTEARAGAGKQFPASLSFAEWFELFYLEVAEGLSNFSGGQMEGRWKNLGPGLTATAAMLAGFPALAFLLPYAMGYAQDITRDNADTLNDLRTKRQKFLEQNTATWFEMPYEEFLTFSNEDRERMKRVYLDTETRNDIQNESLSSFKANFVENMWRARRQPAFDLMELENQAQMEVKRRAELESMLDVVSGDNIGQPGSSPQQLLEPMSFQGFGSGGLVQQAFLRLPQDSAQVVDAIDGASQSMLHFGDTTEVVFSLCHGSLLGYSTDVLLRTQDQERAYSLLNTGITESNRIATTTMGQNWQAWSNDFQSQNQEITASYQAGQAEQQEATRQTAEAVREIQADSFSDFLRQDRETTTAYLASQEEHEEAARRAAEATTGLYADSAETCLALDEAKTGRLIANQERYVDECGEYFRVFEQAWGNTLSAIAQRLADWMTGAKDAWKNFGQAVGDIFALAFSQVVVNYLGEFFATTFNTLFKDTFEDVLESLSATSLGQTVGGWIRDTVGSLVKDTAIGRLFSNAGSWLSRLFDGTISPGENTLTAGGPMGGLGMAAS